MKLKSGEVVCDECKGTGYDLEIQEREYITEYYKKHCKCPKCHGAKKLDWIEAVVGKRNPNPIMNGVTWLPPSAVKPQNAQVGQAYINSNSDECYIYDGTVWVSAVSNSTPL